MAQNPILPIQSGNNLPNLDAENDLHEQEAQDDDMEAYADLFDLDENEVEQEVIELEDGSVVVNFQEKEGPQKNPEFYANLAEEFEEGDLNSLANEYLELIDVDKESRNERDKQYEEGQIGRAHV